MTARNYFEEAIAIDPTCAEAWAALAEWNIRTIHTRDSDSDELVREARAALRRAFEIDPDLQPAHVTSAHLAWEHEYDQETAAKAFDRAFELNPSDAYAKVVYIFYSQAHRRFEEAARAGRDAVRLDPFNQIAVVSAFQPLFLAGYIEESLAMLNEAGERFPDARAPENAWAPERSWVLFDSGRREEALALVEKLPLEYSWVLRIGYLVEMDRSEEAREVLREAVETLPEQGRSSLQMASAHAKLGDREEALAYVERLGEPRGVLAWQVAMVYQMLGDNDRVFELWEICYEDNVTWLTRINALDEFYEPLHKDPRFQSLVERMGLTS
jgi:tetratricopeptide (TPR) repeat protein